MGKDSYTNENWKVIAKALKGKGVKSTGILSEKDIIAILEDIAQYAVAWFDGNGSKYGIQDQTSNLRDSIGVGLFQGGTLITLIAPASEAASPKKWTYHGTQYETKGTDKLQAVLGNIHTANMSTYSLSIVCAAPWGFFLDEGLGPDPLGSGNSSKNGYGWWTSGLVPDVTSYANQKILSK